VLLRDERVEKQTRRASTDPCAEQLIDLDQHRLGNDQLTTQLGDERGSEAVGPVAAVRRRNQRAGVGNDPQRAVTSSRR
jgi:hypothetical protein